MSAQAQQNQSVSANDHHEDQGEGQEFDVSEIQSDLMERLQDVGEQVSGFVKERPLVAVGVAAATGFLLARLFHR